MPNYTLPSSTIQLKPTSHVSRHQRLVEALVNRRRQQASDPLNLAADGTAAHGPSPTAMAIGSGETGGNPDLARAYRQAAASANYAGIGSVGGRGSRNVVPTDAEKFALADKQSERSAREFDNFLNVVTDNIIGKESAGRPDAKNPLSSATGLGQFTKGTWLRTISKHRPDLVERYSRNELLAMRTDPELSRAMTRAHTLDNVARLSRAGIEITPGNAYLAHFLGVDKAIEVINAAPDRPITDYVTGGAVRANPTVLGGGETVQNVRDWANNKMALSYQKLGNPTGVIPTPSPGGSDLTPEQEYAWAGATRNVAPRQPASIRRQAVPRLLPTQAGIPGLLGR